MEIAPAHVLLSTVNRIQDDITHDGMAQPHDDIVFEGVSFAYANGASALHDVSVRIPHGQFVAVVGANGSGKSTFAKHINALLVPTQGRVLAQGRDTRDASAHFRIRSHAGMVFQNPDDQSVASIVQDDVAFGPENLGLDRAEIGERVARALADVGMQHLAHEEIRNLSGGQKQRVAIAGALAMRPDILVLDEPGAMLDARGRAAVLRIVRTLNEQGMTIVLVTHFMEEALEADRVIALDGGRVAFDASPDELFSQPGRVLQMNLELPFALRAAHELRECGLSIPYCRTLDELADAVCSIVGGVLPAGARRPCSELDRSQLQAPHRVAGQHMPEGRAGVFAPMEPIATAQDRFPSSPLSGTPEGAAPQVAIELCDVSFAYDDVHEALSGVNLEIAEGEFCGLIGATGSGKSTLAQLANALLVPTKGTVSVFGTPSSPKKNWRDIRAQVGVVFQYPEQQLFAATVAEDLAFGPRNLGVPADECVQRCREAMAYVGLDYDEYADLSPFNLSGGQQRRVAIAGVLAMRPRVLVLDEPGAGMDPATNAQIKRHLAALNEQGMTIVLISHSMDDVAELCDTVACLDAGRIAFRGSTRDVFSEENAERLQELGLDVPQAVRLAAKLRQRGIALDESPLALDALVQSLSVL